MKEHKKRIEELKALINDHDYRYFVLAEPKISDFEYDMLVKELEGLENQFPHLITPDSPTQRVGRDLTKVFPAVTHAVPMLSLSNTYNREDLYDFDRRVREGLPGSAKVNYVAELKIDGVSVSLIYAGGILKTAATRGDGTTGEDITPNVKTIKSIPISLKDPRFQNFEVRGEIFMSLEGFRRLNEERERDGEKLFANPRNSAAGSLKLQDPRIVSKRQLDIFIYSLRTSDENIDSQSSGLKKLSELGFKVNNHYRICSGINEALEHCSYLETIRDSLPYEVDGAVIKVDSIWQQNILGNIAKSPRWATAFKFKAKGAETRIKKILWQVGRLGTITPVAELEPVFLAGSTISRATLHNLDEIRRKDIREGDYVMIEKGGDVIPKVVCSLKEKRSPDTSEVKVPKTCPVCRFPVIQSPDEAALYCGNNTCPAQLKARIAHFASRNAMDIEGLGESIIDRLVELGFLNSYAEIYNLHLRRNELVNLERMGERSIDNLLNAIQKSREKPFPKVLFALGIRYVGAGAAQKLAENFSSIEAIMHATEEEIESVHEIGPSISRSLKNFFSDKNNLMAIETLKNAGLKFAAEKESAASETLKGKTFVLTGVLDKYTRERASEKIRKLGGKVSSSVSSKTDYLLAGTEAGSKLQKARQLGVRIINEKQFEEMTGDMV